MLWDYLYIVMLWDYLYIVMLCIYFWSQTGYGTTRWFKYDRDYLCVNKSQFVPVIFEPPCTLPPIQRIPGFVPSLLYNGSQVSFPAVKRPGRGVKHPPPSSAEVKERVELYVYSPFGPS